VVRTANDEVSIVGLLRNLGHECPDVIEGRSVKIRCPFGFTHTDMGVDPAFRVYATNTAYCFAGCGYFTPSWLAAQAWDCSSTEAADRLLREVGYVVPSTSESALALLELSDPTPSPADLQAALRVWCLRDPDWPAVEFEEDVLRYFNRLVDLLPHVHDSAAADQWLRNAKTVMGRVLAAKRRVQ
jgi:hypothetical protein